MVLEMPITVKLLPRLTNHCASSCKNSLPGPSSVHLLSVFPECSAGAVSARKVSVPSCAFSF